MARRAAPLVVVAVVAALVRLALAAALPFPTPEDTAYYVLVARNVLEGRGLVTDTLWTYVTPPLVLPRPAFEIWLPLPTLLALPLMAILGPTLTAAQLVPVASGSLVAVLAGLLAGDLARERGRDERRVRTLTLGAGLGAAVFLPLVLHGAVPDSTMLFGALALLACRSMVRLAAAPGSPSRPALAGLGLLIGLAALVRNEALWLGLVWALLVLGGRDGDLRRRLRLVLVPGLAAALAYAPWAVRQALVFGSPFPGQAALNALSVSGEDIFAWRDPPTLARFLDQGMGWFLASRLEGLRHDLVDVLLVPGFPVALVGLVALGTSIARARTLRPLVLLAAITFTVTSLVFAVSTRWGTFLHAAVPGHVLLLVAGSALVDDGMGRLARWRRWHRPTAWLGQGLVIATVGAISLTLGSFAGQARDWETRFEALAVALPAAGVPLGTDASPVITDFPIWYAYALRSPSLALPDEGPASVVDLARRFGARHLLIAGDGRGGWPAVLDAGGAGTCFREVDLPGDVGAATASTAPRLWAIDCP